MVFLPVLNDINVGTITIEIIVCTIRIPRKIFHNL